MQEVFAILIQKLPTFEYEEDQSFRGWLWTVLVNKRREFQAAATVDGDAVGQSDASQRQRDGHGRGRISSVRGWPVLESMRGVPAEDLEGVLGARGVGQVRGGSGVDLEMTENAVYLASLRVCGWRLCQELHGLLT